MRKHKEDSFHRRLTIGEKGFLFSFGPRTTSIKNGSNLSSIARHFKTMHPGLVVFSRVHSLYQSQEISFRGDSKPCFLPFTPHAFLFSLFLMLCCYILCPHTQARQ